MLSFPLDGNRGITKATIKEIKDRMAAKKNTALLL
tara:strand:- start:12 stop:116 length:105 start_codon:yes stop_codon:yes gene_type:complete